MARCVYTGARVLFQEYGVMVAADLFTCGDQILIQFEPQSATFDWLPDDVTHHVKIGHGYHHEKRGVAVVPDSACVGERH